MKLKLKDKNGAIYKLNDRVFDPSNNKEYTIKWNGYSYYADDFYKSSQDNPCGFFSENYHTQCEIIKED